MHKMNASTEQYQSQKGHIATQTSPNAGENAIALNGHYGEYFAFFHTLMLMLTYDPATFPVGICPRERKNFIYACMYTFLYMNIYVGFIHSHQKLDTIQIHLNYRQK